MSLSSTFLLHYARLCIYTEQTGTWNKSLLCSSVFTFHSIICQGSFTHYCGKSSLLVTGYHWSSLRYSIISIVLQKEQQWKNLNLILNIQTMKKTEKSANERERKRAMVNKKAQADEWGRFPKEALKERKLQEDREACYDVWFGDGGTDKIQELSMIRFVRVL